MASSANAAAAMLRWSSSSWYRSLLTEPPFLTEPPMTSCTCRIRPSSTRCGLHDPSGVVHVLELVVACWGPITWQEVSALAQSCKAGRRAVAAGPLLLKEPAAVAAPFDYDSMFRVLQSLRAYGPAIQLLSTYTLSRPHVLGSCTHLRRLRLENCLLDGLLDALPLTITALHMDAVRGVFVDKSMPRRLPKLQLFHYMTDGRDFRHGNGPPPGAMVGFLSIWAYGMYLEIADDLGRRDI